MALSEPWVRSAYESMVWTVLWWFDGDGVLAHDAAVEVLVEAASWPPERFSSPNDRLFFCRWLVRKRAIRLKDRERKRFGGVPGGQLLHIDVADERVLRRGRWSRRCGSSAGWMRP